jgi:hypothetical protein
MRISNRSWISHSQSIDNELMIHIVLTTCKNDWLGARWHELGVLFMLCYQVGSYARMQLFFFMLWLLVRGT